MIRLALAAASCCMLAACAATGTDEPVAAASAPPPPAIDAEPSRYALAMDTVAILTEQGNEQAAIDRLTQLLGNPEVSREQQATALYTRAKLRYGEGNDVYGAIDDLDEMLALMPDHPDAAAAAALRDTARGEATSINFALETQEMSRTERFETLFRLGEHQQAMDMMLETGLTPSNDYLIDLYQMGYLCEGAEYGGPAYAATEPDGTARQLRHCDFGK